ncbi:MAG: hypothetical protein KKD21_06150 [Proteobacteria bacterium]|nr:hypothetical protein [Pseudomonadota bacterium]MBU1696613.1 hypothetical protein [Pseudomonadota bacterium]
MNENRLNGYIRKRTHSMGWSMVVMGVSFFLYYLGLFGNVEGPLSPETLGETLAGMGFEKIHMLSFFLSFFIIALTWNHIFNLVTYITGSSVNPVKKGVVSHTIWVVALVFCVILMYC